jgi:hypothetical protein
MNGEGLYLFASSLRTTSEVSRETKSRKKILQEKQNKALTDADNVGYHVRPTETTVAWDASRKVSVSCEKA